MLQWRPHDRSWSRFGMISDCDGRSDGRSDGQTESIIAKTALCVASYADALSKMKLIGSPIAEIWQFEIFKMAAGRHIRFSWIWRSTKWFFLLFMTYSFVFDIAHHNQLLKSSKINKCSSEKYDFMHFGGHIGFLAAILDLRQNLRWPRSVFQIVWSEVHEY